MLERSRPLLNLLVLFVATGFAFECTQGQEKAPSYKVLKEEVLGATKRSVVIRLPAKVTEAELRKFAEQVKASNPKRFERAFITYLLPEQEEGKGAWATSHFNPELEVSILGVPKDAALPQPEGELIGRWEYNPGIGMVYTLSRIKEGFKLARVIDGAAQPDMTVTAQREGTRVIVRPTDPDAADEYWIVDEQKNLLIMDSSGLVGKASSIKKP